jgi:hypothetical protein
MLRPGVPIWTPLPVEWSCASMVLKRSVEMFDAYPGPGSPVPDAPVEGIGTMRPIFVLVLGI